MVDQAPEFNQQDIDDANGPIDTTVDGNGKTRMLTETNVTSVNVPQGQDPLPDMFFTVTNAGGAGDTVRVQIAATSNDSSSPDRDLPAVDVTTTLTSNEVGNEQALADRDWETHIR